jgi:hypothetical protein
MPVFPPQLFSQRHNGCNHKIKTPQMQHTFNLPPSVFSLPQYNLDKASRRFLICLKRKQETMKLQNLAAAAARSTARAEGGD